MLAAVGEQSDKPIVSSFLGVQGLPELLRVPDVRGQSAGRGSVPSYPAVESAARALARVVEYAIWLRHGDDVKPWENEEGHNAAKHLVNELLMGSREGRDLDQSQVRRLLECYGIECWTAQPVNTLDEAIAAGAEQGWDVVLKATTERLRNRPDLAHVWRNIDTPSEMRDAWTTLTETISTPAEAGFVVQRNAPPGVPVAVSSLEDPFFGPVVSFSIAGPFTELLSDKSYGIPPMSPQAAADMVREIKSSALLFGYQGGEVVDIDAIEDLLVKVGRLQHDLPQVRALNLPLVMVSAQGARVLSASARIEPVVDPRSDWFVRKLSSMADTAPG